MGGVGEMWLEAGRLIRGEVPWFVKAFGSRADGPVPVFIYHTIDPVVFEAHLLFLAENGYETWDADTYLEYMSGRTKGNPRAVVLTIDDARLSVWTRGYPLLKKYGARAVVFVIPGLTAVAPPRESSGKSLADGDDEIVNWSEIRLMHESGHVDIQSHSLLHAQVPTCGRVVGFLGPSVRIRAFDSIPAPKGYEFLAVQPDREVFAGFPIFEGRSLFEARSRYVPPEGFLEDCVSAFRSGALSGNCAGQREISRFLDGIGWGPARLVADGRYEPLLSEVRESLIRSREMIEERLPGKKVRHFCFPYGAYSDEAVAAVKGAGYSSAYLSYVQGKGENRPGDSPYAIVRLKNDYLLRLPGAGRKSLASVIGLKLARRLRGESGY